MVHGGDVFCRSRVPPGLVDRAFAPLKAVADRGRAGVRRSRQSRALPDSPSPPRRAPGHPRLRSTPRRSAWRCGGLTLAVAGFPFVRHGLRAGLPRPGGEHRLARRVPPTRACSACTSAWRAPRWGPRATSSARATTSSGAGSPRGLRGGPGRSRPPPPGARAGTCGGARCRPRSLYAGSTERTSFAERDEDEGLPAARPGGGRHRARARARRRLPRAPDAADGAGRAAGGSRRRLGSDRGALGPAGPQHPDAIVRLRIARPRPGGPS